MYIQGDFFFLYNEPLVISKSINVLENIFYP